MVSLSCVWCSNANLSRLFAVVDNQAVLIEPVTVGEGPAPVSGYARWVLPIDAATVSEIS